MIKNEVLKIALHQNLNFGENAFFIEDDLFRSIDALEVLKSTGAKSLLLNLIKDVVMTNWKGEVEGLKMVIKEINLLSGKGFENGKIY